MIDPFAQFRAEIEVYLAETGMDPTNFGKAVLKDPCFVFDIRGGRSPRASTFHRVRSYMADNPPPKRGRQRRAG